MAYAPPAAASNPSPPSIGVCAGFEGGGGGWAETISGKTITINRIAIKMPEIIKNFFIA